MLNTLTWNAANVVPVVRTIRRTWACMVAASSEVKSGLLFGDVQRFSLPHWIEAMFPIGQE